jgi:3-isopropylmalate/(R)-2-methylmalate dehydratase small subunit
LVPVLVDDATAAWLLANPGADVTIDLETTTLSMPNGKSVKFPLEPFARYCLMNGVDELGFLLSKNAEISAYESKRVFT